jgi:hypothetical protein
MSSNPAPKTAFYRRTFRVGNRLRLESTCLYCGTHIVCELSESLNERESDHFATCAVTRTALAATPRKIA